MKTTVLTIQNLRAEIAKAASGQWSLFDQAIQDAAEAGYADVAENTGVSVRAPRNIFETTIIDRDEWQSAVDDLRSATSEQDVVDAIDRIAYVTSVWLCEAIDAGIMD